MGVEDLGEMGVGGDDEGFVLRDGGKDRGFLASFLWGVWMRSAHRHPRGKGGVGGWLVLVCRAPKGDRRGATSWLFQFIQML